MNLLALLPKKSLATFTVPVPFDDDPSVGPPSDRLNSIHLHQEEWAGPVAGHLHIPENIRLVAQGFYTRPWTLPGYLLTYDHPCLDRASDASLEWARAWAREPGQIGRLRNQYMLQIGNAEAWLQRHGRYVADILTFCTVVALFMGMLGGFTGLMVGSLLAAIPMSMGASMVIVAVVILGTLLVFTVLAAVPVPVGLAVLLLALGYLAARRSNMPHPAHALAAHTHRSRVADLAREREARREELSVWKRGGRVPA